jgi:hypothetical protein
MFVSNLAYFKISMLPFFDQFFFKSQLICESNLLSKSKNRHLCILYSFKIQKMISVRLIFSISKIGFYAFNLLYFENWYLSFFRSTFLANQKSDICAFKLLSKSKMFSLPVSVDFSPNQKIDICAVIFFWNLKNRFLWILSRSNWNQNFFVFNPRLCAPNK